MITTLTFIDPLPDEGVTVTVEPGSGKLGILTTHERLSGAVTDTVPDQRVKVPVPGGGFRMQLIVALMMAGEILRDVVTVPDCVTVKACPAMVIVPVRWLVLVLVKTE